MKAKKKEVKPVKAADLKLDAASIGAAGAKSKVLKCYSPPQRKAAQIIAGRHRKQKAAKLVKLLARRGKSNLMAGKSVTQLNELYVFQ